MIGDRWGWIEKSKRFIPNSYGLQQSTATPSEITPSNILEQNCRKLDPAMSLESDKLLLWQCWGLFQIYCITIKVNDQILNVKLFFLCKYSLSGKKSNYNYHILVSGRKIYKFLFIFTKKNDFLASNLKLACFQLIYTTGYQVRVGILICRGMESKMESPLGVSSSSFACW